MPSHAAVEQSVLRALEQLNEQLAAAEQVKVGPDSLLYGGGGPLDSLGLISLMFMLEKQLEADLGIKLTLAMAVPGPGAADPFRRVDTLVDWLSPLCVRRAA